MLDVSKIGQSIPIDKIKEDYRLFLKKLEEKKPFSLLNFGDGEWNFVLWQRERSTQREVYSEEGRQGLIQALNKSVQYDNCFLATMDPNIPGKFLEFATKSIEYLEEIKYTKRKFHCMMHYYALECGELFPLIENLRKRELVMIGAVHLKKLHNILPYKTFIKVPKKGATLHVDKIEQEILKANKGEVYCFSAGIASNILIGRLHSKIDASLIDFGYTWDPFTKRNWRAETLPRLNNKMMKRNLGYGF